MLEMKKQKQQEINGLRKKFTALLPRADSDLPARYIL